MRERHSSPQSICMGLMIKSLHSIFPALARKLESSKTCNTPETSSYRQNIRDKHLKVMSAALLLLSVSSIQKVEAAVCIWNDIGRKIKYNSIATKNLDVTLSEGHIGAVIGQATIEFSKAPNSHVFCADSKLDEGWSIDFAPGKQLEQIGNKIYKSGIDGLGLRFFIHPNRYEFPYIDNKGGGFTYLFNFRSLTVEVIRMGHIVGGNSLTTTLDLDIELVLDRWPAQKISGTTQLTINNVPYYSSCTPIIPVIDVPLGETEPADIRNDTTTPYNFNLDILCETAKPEEAPTLSVKVYFQGDNNGDGLLKIATSQVAATGVQISLEDTNNRKLPFDQSRALTVPKDRLHERGVIHSLPIVARYVSDGTPVTSGPADASLTYVIEYN